MLFDKELKKGIFDTFTSPDNEIIGVKEMKFVGYVRSILKSNDSNEDKIKSNNNDK